jgi:hypothetical protein
VHELAEPNSAFRLDSEHTSSVRATYFAFKAIVNSTLQFVNCSNSISRKN